MFVRGQRKHLGCSNAFDGFDNIFAVSGASDDFSGEFDALFTHLVDLIDYVFDGRAVYYNTLWPVTKGTEHRGDAKPDHKAHKGSNPWLFHKYPEVHPLTHMRKIPTPSTGEMKFFNHIQLLPLLVGLFFGMFFVYVLKPTPTVIYKYPTMDNAGKVTYQDRNGVCFKYHADTVDCDKNEARITSYPLQ